MKSVLGRVSATVGAALLATVPIISVVGAAPANAKPGQEVVAICHYNVDTPVPSWQLLNVKPKALASHIKHGDGYPSQLVPGTDGLYIFDEYCVPQPVTTGEKIYAIAYADMNPDDGDYNAEVDLLIAKVVEASGDSWLGSGDKVITDRYLKSFYPMAYGTFLTTEHMISTDLTSGDTIVHVLSGPNHFIFSHFATSEYYEENKGSAETKSYWQDKTDGSMDEIRPNYLSPSWPQENLSAVEYGPGDDTFLDVWIAPSA